MVAGGVETMDFSMPSYSDATKSESMKSKSSDSGAPSFNPFGDFDFGMNKDEAAAPAEEASPAAPAAVKDTSKEDAKAAEKAKKEEEKAAAAAKKAEEKAAAEAKKAEEKAAAEAKKAEKEARRKAELEKQKAAVERAKEAKEETAVVSLCVSNECYLFVKFSYHSCSSKMSVLTCCS